MQFLIGHGHSLEAIRGYTLFQLKQFTAAAQRQERRQLRDRLVVARAAQYEKSDYKKFMQALED
jgi:hypothetical protein